MAARTDNRIEPIPVWQQQYQNDDSSAILEISRREGELMPVFEKFIWPIKLPRLWG